MGVEVVDELADEDKGGVGLAPGTFPPLVLNEEELSSEGDEDDDDEFDEDLFKLV